MLWVALVELVFDEFAVLDFPVHQWREHVAGGIPPVRDIGAFVENGFPVPDTWTAEAKSPTVGRIFLPAGVLSLVRPSRMAAAVTSRGCWTFPAASIAASIKVTVAS